MAKYKVIYTIKTEWGDLTTKEMQFLTIKSARASKKYIGQYMCAEGKLYELVRMEDSDGGDFWNLIQQKSFGNRKWEVITTKNNFHH
jgi:hypothetical protein